MATTFIDAVRACLSQGGYARTEDVRPPFTVVQAE